MFRRGKDNTTDEIEKIENLYSKYRNIMLKEANRVLNDVGLAEDAVQQSFINIMKNIDKVDESDEAKTRNFLVIICRNVAFDLYKKRLYLNQNSDSIDYETEEEEDAVIDFREPSKIVIDKETVRKVAGYIADLPPIYRDVLLLEKLHNYTKEEIAELLGINYETVRKRCLRARKMLVEALEKEDDIL